MSRSVQIKLEDHLRTMKGKTFMYNSMNINMLSWKYEGEYCTIVTSGPWKTLPTGEMLPFLKAEFLEVELEEGEPGHVPATTQPDPILLPSIKGLDRCGDLINLLFSNIDKVSTDKDYVNQAKSVSELTNNVIDVVKLQLDAIKTANDVNRNR